MTNKQKQELIKIEERILDMGPYCDEHGLIESIHQWEQQRKDELKTLLRKRCNLLNEMFECRPEELERFKKVNDRLNDLTKKMHAKALSLYRSILEQGYDPDFDDDIMVEGTLRYVCNDKWESVIQEDVLSNIYGSDFGTMVDILCNIYTEAEISECASCWTSYDLRHRSDMKAEDLGLDDFLDLGDSWNEVPLDRPEFKGICICHAVHDICCRKAFSIPDLIRMDDFWIDIKITHQHLVNQDGKRFSYIEKNQ